MIRKILLAVMLAAGASSCAFAQTSFTAKDASGTTQTFKSFNCNTSNICSLSVPADTTGAAFGVTGNPFFVSPATGATFPISAASLPLPTGAATAAGLTTINTTLGSPFQAGGSIGNTTFASTQSGNWTVRNVGNAGAILDFAGQNASSPANAFLMGGQFNTTPTTITSGNASPLQLDSAGNLLVNVKAGGGSGGTSSSFGAAFPSTGTAIGLTNGTNMVAWSATTNYGTAPSAIAVPAVNAFITNTNANGAAAASSSSPVTPSNQPVGGANFANTQVSVGSTATQIVAARTGVSGTGRISATVCNTSTVAVYLGGSGVTTSTGQYLAGVAGACATFQTTAAIYGIVATGTETVGATEVY